MELTHWMFVVGGVAAALGTQWFLQASFRCAWQAQITEQVTQSAALVDECAAGTAPRV
ncbi:hypothetical protein VLK31_12515 [Variovorax sp. H27-G14]|uniref:hypothetical protein n=1 Tax=Variovorax sp. H27-G14 TaxID=3111914 RepID=UPI0038FC4822